MSPAHTSTQLLLCKLNVCSSCYWTHHCKLSATWHRVGKALSTGKCSYSADWFLCFRKHVKIRVYFWGAFINSKIVLERAVLTMTTLCTIPFPSVSVFSADTDQLPRMCHTHTHTLPPSGESSLYVWWTWAEEARCNTGWAESEKVTKRSIRQQGHPGKRKQQVQKSAVEMGRTQRATSDKFLGEWNENSKEIFS